ncbi:HEPN domain-containing protein [Cylindrospermum stagnale]|nr:HEPN domain-containing protein [Cylindrospermum stagnale]
MSNNVKILAHRQKIDNLFNQVKSTSNPKDQSEWSKYLCVLVSGFIEESLRVLLEEYARKHSSTYIQNFVETEIRYITNCKTNKIILILKQFSQAWATDFENQIQVKSRITGEIKDALDSIVTNRHSIAHGKSGDITYVRVLKYYNNVKIAVEILEDIIR